MLRTVEAGSSQNQETAPYTETGGIAGSIIGGVVGALAAVIILLLAGSYYCFAHPPKGGPTRWQSFEREHLKPLEHRVVQTLQEQRSRFRERWHRFMQRSSSKDIKPQLAGADYERYLEQRPLRTPRPPRTLEEEDAWLQSRAVQYTFPNTTPLGMYLKQAGGYVFVQGVIPNLQAHQAGVQAGSIVLGIDRGFGWTDLAGVSCDEIIVQIEDSPRPFSMSMRPPPGFADDDTGAGALPLGQAGQPDTLDRSALPVGFGGRDLVNPGRVRFAGAAGVASPDDDALPEGQLETLCARHESSSETETVQRQRSARSAAKPVADAMVFALEEDVPQVRAAAQKKQQYGAMYMPNVPQQLSPGRHEALLLPGLRPPPAPRSVSLKELSHLRSLISAGMQESEAHRVLEAARETPQARAHLESVLAAQGSSAGLYAGDPTWEEYQARDSRLKELDGMLSEGMMSVEMSGIESDGTALP